MLPEHVHPDFALTNTGQTPNSIHTIWPITPKGGARMIARFTEDQVLLQRVQELRPIADELGLSMSQLAIAWILQRRNIAAAIIGASRPEQVTENVKAAGVRLDDATMAAIDEALGDVVERDPAKTAANAPKTRPPVS